MHALPWSGFQRVLSQYYDANGSIQGVASLGGTYVDGAVAAPAAVDGAAVTAEVAHAIAVNGWQRTPDSQFIVLTGPGTTYASSFTNGSPASFCAFHSDDASGSVYSFVPYADGPFATCANYDPGSSVPNAVTMTLSHEYAESATDPDVDNWLTTDGYEVADICASGDDPMGGGVYVQGLWSNHQNACSLSYAKGDSAALSRWYNSATNYEWSGTDVPSSTGYTVEFTLGFLASSPSAGMQGVYGCVSGADQFASGSPTCEGAVPVGQYGWIRTTTAPNTYPVYRCAFTSHAGHFVSNDAGCEGQHTDYLLGYAASTGTLERYGSASGMDNWSTTGGRPAAYSPVFDLGQLQIGGSNPALGPVYGCLVGADRMSSGFANCEGAGIDTGLEGWVYTSSGSGRVSLYRCDVLSIGDHFDSTDPNCEGNHTDYLLGYVPWP